MKLPSADQVLVDQRKIHGYLLSQTHPVDRFKARVFAALGFDESKADAFVAELRRIAATGEVSEVEDTELGRKYTVPGDLNGPAGTFGPDRLDPGSCRGGSQARHRSPEVAMKFALLDTVVLNRDVPEHGLRAGDLGAVVELYGEDGVEVEFVQPSGQTKALVTLKAADLRSVGDRDIHPPNRVEARDRGRRTRCCRRAARSVRSALAAERSSDPMSIREGPPGDHTWLKAR